MFFFYSVFGWWCANGKQWNTLCSLELCICIGLSVSACLSVLSTAFLRLSNKRMEKEPKTHAHTQPTKPLYKIIVIGQKSSCSIVFTVLLLLSYRFSHVVSLQFFSSSVGRCACRVFLFADNCSRKESNWAKIFYRLLRCLTWCEIRYKISKRPKGGTTTATKYRFCSY